MNTSWTIGRWGLVACAVFAIGATPVVYIDKPQNQASFIYTAGLLFDVDGDTDSSVTPPNKPTGVLRIAVREHGLGPEIWYDTQTITIGNFTTTAYPYSYWPIGSANSWAGIYISGSLVVSTHNSIGFISYP